MSAPRVTPAHWERALRIVHELGDLTDVPGATDQSLASDGADLIARALAEAESPAIRRAVQVAALSVLLVQARTALESCDCACVSEETMRAAAADGQLVGECRRCAALRMIRTRAPILDPAVMAGQLQLCEQPSCYRVVYGPGVSCPGHGPEVL